MDLSIIINDLNNLISKQFDTFKGSYLYGSRVKGDYKDDSDIDLAIIFDNKLNYNQRLDLAGLICEIEYKYDIFIDYHPFTLEELNFNVVFSAEVITKGIYYAAA
jgi:predicted nucleotidyltransferase